MLPKSIIAVVATASSVIAATPPGFEPGSKTSLLVAFGDVAALDGVVVEKDVTQTAPKIATESKLDGETFAILMIDLDIPTDSPPKTNTLLHWMQTGLTQSSSSEDLNITGDSTTGFVFSAADGLDAFASYKGPAPPAKIPLSHRYTEIIIDTSDASEESLDALKKAAANRQGFDAKSVLSSAGLSDKVVAGNFFNVTNPGPVNSTTGSEVPKEGVAVSQQVSASLLAIAMGIVAVFM